MPDVPGRPAGTGGKRAPSLTPASVATEPAGAAVKLGVTAVATATDGASESAVSGKGVRERGVASAVAGGGVGSTPAAPTTPYVFLPLPCITHITGEGGAGERGMSERTPVRARATPARQGATGSTRGTGRQRSASTRTRGITGERTGDTETRGRDEPRDGDTQQCVLGHCGAAVSLATVFQQAAPSGTLGTSRASMGASEHNAMAHTLLRVLGRVDGTDASILIDGGASHDFVSRSFLQRVCGESTEAGTITLHLGDGRALTQPLRLSEPLLLTMDRWVETRSFMVLPQASHDIILGKPWLARWNPAIDWTTNAVHMRETGTGLDCVIMAVGGAGDPELHFISARQATRALRAGEEAFVVWLQAADAVVDRGARVACTNAHDRARLNSLLERFQDCMPSAVTALPPHRHIDHRIDIVPGASPPSRKPFRLSQPELLELKRVLEQLLARGFIQPSVSPYGAPVFFVPKPDGSLRFICDWRELNRITIRNKACIPNVEDLFDRVQGARFFSHLDLHLGYNQVLVRDEDVFKTAIATPFGHFEWRVMGLGMTNAPATFQTLMTDVFRSCLFDSVVVFLDDILVFSDSFDDHLRHLETVFNILREHQLHAKPTKCIFGAAEVKFLGHIISGHTLRADPEKLACVESWAVPGGVREVRVFVGFANYFRRFIADFATLAAPLDELLRKGCVFRWGPRQQQAFDVLRERLLSAPVLHLPDTKRPFRVETDASDTRVAAVLLQEHGGDWHPVAYLSRRLTDTETRYTTSEREALAAVWALGVWRLYLFQHFQLFTDNRTLAHLHTKPHLSRREAGWMDTLADFDFELCHRRGVDNGAADALSRATFIDEPAAVDGELAVMESVLSVGQDVLDQIRAGYTGDPFCARLMRDLREGTAAEVSKSCFELRDNLLLRRHEDGTVRVVVPDVPKLRVFLLGQLHDCITAGHPGRERTYSRVQRTCFWPRMYQDVRQFVASCDVCQRTKPLNQSTAALLQPLPVPEARWESVALDLITDLPRSTSGFDSVVTFTDRLSKRVHLAATTKTVSARELASVFMERVFVLHGLPRTLVSDRDPRFTSDFWRELFQLLGSKLAMSTANHPQTDGQSESTNKTVEQVLRAFANYRMDNWADMLPLVEFAINDSRQSSTGMSPFVADTGVQPLTPVALLAPRQVTVPGDAGRFVAHQASVLQEVRDVLVVAQQRQIATANVHRSLRVFNVGDSVLVSTDYLLSPEQRQRPRRKLLPAWQGPWRVVEVTSPSALRLDLPRELRAHPVISIEAVRLYHENTLEHRVAPPPPSVLSVDDPTEEKDVVEEVLDVRVRRGRTWYLAKWAGKRLSDASWLPEENFFDDDGTITEALLVFQQRHGLGAGTHA